eukprot:XP_001699952.1 DnaJ-like protein [Chlamydomonas reinhardtii]
MDGTTYLRQFGGGLGGGAPASGAGASVRSGLSPMDITPQGSVGSAASAASNMFVLSPLAGGFGASAGAQQGGGSVNGGGPTAMPISPMPFQGFAAAAGAPPTPTPMFTAGVVPAPAAARPHAAAPAVPAPAFVVGTSASSGTSSSGGTASSAGGAAKPPIQIHMPGARDVADMFTAAAAASTASTAAAFSATGGTSTSSGGAAPVRPASAAAPAQPTAATAAAVFGAAGKKPGAEAAGACAGPGGVPAGASFRSGGSSSDLQPPKDSSAKLSREPSGSSKPANGSSSWAHVPVPPAAAPATAPDAPSRTAPAAAPAPAAPAAPAPASQPAASGSSASDALSTRVYQECYAEMRGRALTGGSASAAAEATARSVAARAVELMSAAPTTRMLVEKLIESGSCADVMIKAALDMPEPAKAADTAAAAAPPLAAPVAAATPPQQAEAGGPGRAEAAVESMLKEMKLEDQRTAGIAGTAAAPSISGSAGSPLSVPFVFAAPPGGNSSSASTCSAAPAPAPAAAAMPPAAADPAPAPAAAAAAGMASGPGPQPAVHTHVPFVFGSTGGGAAAPAAPAFTFGGSPPPGAAKPATSSSSTGGGIPFTFGGRSPAAAAEQARPSTSNVFAAAAATSAAAFATAGTTRPASAVAAGGGTSRSSGAAGQVPPVSSSSGWTNVPRAPATSAAAESVKFNVGAAAAGGVGGAAFAGAGEGAAAAGVSGTTPGRASAKGRAKVTPRKGRAPSASATSAGGAASAATAGAAAQTSSVALGGGSAFNAAASTAAPATSSATSASASRAGTATASTAEQPQRSGASFSQQQQQQQQAGDNMPSVQAVRLKRTADEKKQQGNAKYEQNDFRTAERWYTEAIDLLEQQLPGLGLSEQQAAALFPNLKTEVAVLYSNRSGARLMTSKPHSALADALKAMALDGKFLRAASRAATCHCRLGNFSAAHRVVETAMERVSLGSPHYQDICKKLHEVVDLGSKARAATAAAVAAAGNGGRDKLQEAADALAAIRDQVAYCDVVAAARAVLALRLGAAADALALVAPHPEVPPAERAAPWRLWLVAQARFFKGDLQEALTTCRELQLQLQAKGGAAEADTSSGAAAAAYTTAAHVAVPPAAALGELADAIQQLIKLKEDGNAAFKASKHAEASEIYSKALSSGACPPAFASVLHANRAAAAQGLGQLADAVADCGRARALDPTYYKASARLAGLMLELRRPENAQGLLESLTKLAGGDKDKDKEVGPSATELEAIKGRLTEAKAAVSWQKTPHHYKLLGLTNTCSEEEVRKAYRRLALKHHPDKAMSAVKVALTVPGAAGASPYSGPLAAASELEARVRDEAAWLFNFINQAHEELSDKARRRKVDQLLEVEQPPAARYGAGSAYSSNPYSNAFGSAGGSRYGGYGGFYDPSSYFYRAAPTGAGAQRARTGAGYGGSYGGARPAGARPPAGGSAGGAAGAARGGGGSRPTHTAGSGGGNYGGYTGRAGAAGTAGQRKWWEGTDSDDEDQDAYHF